MKEGKIKKDRRSDDEGEGGQEGEEKKIEDDNREERMKLIERGRKLRLIEDFNEDREEEEEGRMIKGREKRKRSKI